jgi:hypothetical protein
MASSSPNQLLVREKPSQFAVRTSAMAAVADIVAEVVDEGVVAASTTIAALIIYATITTTVDVEDIRTDVAAEAGTFPVEVDITALKVAMEGLLR